MSLGARHQHCGIDGSRPLGIHLRGCCVPSDNYDGRFGDNYDGR
jgi:hypothetical protein